MSRFNPNALLEVSHLVEHLKAVPLAIAHIHQTAVIHHHAMDHSHECAAITSCGFVLCSLTSPLPQKFSALIKHDDAMITVAIGDVNVTVGRVDRDIRRLVQE